MVKEDFRCERMEEEEVLGVTRSGSRGANTPCLAVPFVCPQSAIKDEGTPEKEGGEAGPSVRSS